MEKSSATSEMLEALNRAIKIAGSQAELSEKIGLERTASNIAIMVNRDKKASATYVARISAVTGIPCHELRPDIFPAPANDETY